MALLPNQPIPDKIQRDNQGGRRFRIRHFINFSVSRSVSALLFGVVSK